MEYKAKSRIGHDLNKSCDVIAVTVKARRVGYRRGQVWNR